MSKILRALFERAGPPVLGFAFVSLLYYYGGLHFEAALLVGIAFAIVAIWLYILKDIALFKPYRLIVGINYEALWEDLKLSPADGPKFENVVFTAINAALLARSDERQYSSRLDLYKVIPCGAHTWTPGFGEIRNGPTFYFRPARDGYQFGVQVQEEWWKLHSPQLMPKLRDQQCSYGNEIMLGLLPYGYMPEHIRRWSEPISFWYGFDRKQSRWKKTLLENGWTFSEDYPDHINHRYLGIGYKDL